MIFLILSILASAAIYALFKVFPKYKIDTFQAIVVNYIVAAIFGFLLTSQEEQQTFQIEWIGYAALLGCAYISIFNLMARSSQIFGVAVTGLSAKMSMVIPVCALIIFDPEELPSWAKMAGISMGLFAVYLAIAPDKANPTKEIAARTGHRWIPIVVFLGSGILDLGLALTEKFLLGSPAAISAFTPIPFGVAGLIGISILTYQGLKGNLALNMASFIAGIVLGLINFASMYYLFLYLGSGWLERSASIPVNNIGIVVLSAIVGFVLFKESVTPRKIIGLCLAIGSILVLTLWIS